jgi:hypothetical protein
MNKQKWYNHAMEYYLIKKRNELLTHVASMDHDNIMLCEQIQTQKTTYYIILFIRRFREVISIQIESKFSIASICRGSQRGLVRDAELFQ